jgi:hypothetical protein
MILQRAFPLLLAPRGERLWGGETVERSSVLTPREI